MKIITDPLKMFLKDSRFSGILLVACTLFSLLLTNSKATGLVYNRFWHLSFLSHQGYLHLPETPLAIVNDFFMAFFFFLVGLEIKRELTVGELASIKKSLLPVIAAIGGMFVPAIIFYAFNHGTAYNNGWAIPTATDIAFSLGVLSLLGNRVPIQLKIFLTALAIIDDLGAVITIAFFYAGKINSWFIIIALLFVFLIYLYNKLLLNYLFPYLLMGLVLWWVVLSAGIHATIAGVVMSFLMPLHLLAKAEHQLFYIVNFFIMPIFALANAAIMIPHDFWASFSNTLSWGIMIGLILGKPLGIFIFSFIAIRLKIASAPANTNFKLLLGAGILGGIGFTMSIFTATLAYNNVDMQTIAKVSVMVASVVAGLGGYLCLRFWCR